MGDRVQMEIKRKKREVTLAGLFTRYTVIFCVNILLIFVILIGVICLFPLSSLFLPANYAEEQIDEKRDAIAEADVVTSDLIPNRCSYGVYDADGWYLYGFFSGAGCELSMNEDNSNNCDWNSETGLAVAQSIENITSSPAFVSVQDQDAITMLNDGTLGAYVSGTWNTGSFEAKYGDGYAACKLPTFDVNGTATQMGSYAGYKFVGVNSHAKNVGWSMLLAEYLTNEESQLAIGNATSEGPANTVAAAQIDSPALAALAAQSEFADQQVVGNNYWDPAKALGQNLVDGATDLQAVLDDAVAGITQPVAE